MEKLPISLITLCSSKGHWNRKEIYLKTLNDWNNKGYLGYFLQKIAHIKVSPGESDFASEMDNNISNFGFFVLKTEKQWRHHDSSHFLGIIDDLHTLCREARQEYVFILECDWLIHEYTADFYDCLNDAIQTIDLNPDIISIRVPRHKTDPEHFPGTVNYDKDPFWNCQNHLFSFNPTIMKRSVLYSALCVAKHNIELVRNNSEVGMTQILRNFSMMDKPFFSYPSSVIRALHIGVENETLEDQP